jgi:hypothetical protein
MVGYLNRFVLQEIGDGGVSLSTIYERGDTRTFKPGRYIIGTLYSNFFFTGSNCISVSKGIGEEIFLRSPKTFGSAEEEVPHAKKAKVSEMATEGSVVSTRVWFIHYVH